MKEMDHILSAITFDKGWTPDAKLMSDVFSIISEQYLISSPIQYQYEESGLFKMLIDPKMIYWAWNTFPNQRHSFLLKLISHYSRRQYVNGNYISTLQAESKQAIIDISTVCFDATPDDSNEIPLQELRIKIISALSIDRHIDFAGKFMFANLSKDRNLSDFWFRNGIEHSRDPNFYSMAWSKIDRSPGYVDKRDAVIHAATKCDFYPESIIGDLVSSGHAKNKLSLITKIANKVITIERKIGLYVVDSELKQNLKEAVLRHKMTLGRFVGCDDYNIQRQIIPHLTREDLIFAAPIASGLGLNSLIEKYMGLGRDT